MTKAVLTFAGFAAGLSGVFAYFHYSRKLEEVKVPAATIYFHEMQADYKVAGEKWKDIIIETDKRLTDLYAKKQAWNYFMTWDNPRHLYSNMQARCAFGALVDKVAGDFSDLGIIEKNLDLHHVSIPSTEVLKLSINLRGHKGWLYHLLWWFFAKRYYARYEKRLKQAGYAFFPLGELKTPSSDIIFAPLPEYIQYYQFLREPQPEMNMIGKMHQKRLIGDKVSEKPKVEAKPVLKSSEKVAVQSATPSNEKKIESKPATSEQKGPAPTTTATPSAEPKPTQPTHAPDAKIAVPAPTPKTVEVAEKTPSSPAAPYAEKKA